MKIEAWVKEFTIALRFCRGIEIALGIALVTSRAVFLLDHLGLFCRILPPPPYRAADPAVTFLTMQFGMMAVFGMLTAETRARLAGVGVWLIWCGGFALAKSYRMNKRVEAYVAERINADHKSNGTEQE